MKTSQIILLLLFTVLQASNVEDPFLIFDGLLYKNKPDLEAEGLRPITIIYEGAMWSSGADRDEIEEAKLRMAVTRAAADDAPVVLDIEYWQISGVEEVEMERNLEKYLQALQIAKAAAPESRIGYYGLVPHRVYWPIVKNDKAELKEWARTNKELRPIVENVDFVCPSIYTFYDDEDGWETYAKAMLREARRYNKPVYAFIWPEYHNSNQKLTGQKIPGDFWKKQLEICKRHADGVVIWGGFQTEWNDRDEWWQVTKEFINKNR